LVMAYRPLLVVILVEINQQDTPPHQPVSIHQKSP